MKRIFSILFALVLAVSMTFIAAPIAKAQTPVTVTVELRDSVGNGSSGGYVEYRGQGPGAESPNKWSEFGTTGDDGTVTKDLSPGNYWFSIKYNHTYAKIKQDISVDDIVSFTTTTVTLWFSGDITYNSKVNPGTWVPFEGSTEMLPDTYAFRFGKADYPWASAEIEVSGDSVEKTIAYIRVLKSDGYTGQEEVTARWWVYGGTSAPVPGATNDKGVLLNAMQGRVNASTCYAVSYLGAEQGKWQNPVVNSFYIYQLVNVTVELRDNTGALITSGPQPQVYFWAYGKPELSFGTMVGGQVSMDLLPYNYLFLIKNYQGISQRLGPITITTSTTVVFQTGKVVDGGFGCDVYWQYGGPTMPFSDPMQLLPGYHYFRDNDTGTQKRLNVYAGQTLNLQTGTYTTP